METSIPEEKLRQTVTGLARKALETWVLESRRIAPPESLPAFLLSPAACFVCIKMAGQLRGCIGTVEPDTPTLAEEIIRNAIACGTNDPRFLPVTPAELNYLKYTVDVLGPMRQVETLDNHDPVVHGLMVESRGRRGLLLPDIAGIDTKERQLEICLAKAGIPCAKDLEHLYQFEIQRFAEEPAD